MITRIVACLRLRRTRLTHLDTTWSYIKRKPYARPVRLRTAQPAIIISLTRRSDGFARRVSSSYPRVHVCSCMMMTSTTPMMSTNSRERWTRETGTVRVRKKWKTERTNEQSQEKLLLRNVVICCYDVYGPVRGRNENGPGR